MTRRAVGIVAGLVVLVALALLLIVFGRDEVYSKEQKARLQLQFLSDALQDYAKEGGSLPSAGEGLGVLVKSGQVNPDGLRDPWDQPISYKCKDEKCDLVELASAGPPGGAAKESVTLAVRKRQ